MIDALAYVELQQWYATEAALLDDRRLDAWIELLDDDVDYRVPARWSRVPARPDDFASWDAAAEFDDDVDHLPLVHLDRAGIVAFVDRLRTGVAWAETPPSRTTRIVGPPVVVASDGDEVSVRSALSLHRSRVEWEDATLWASRHDTLVRRSGRWHLRRRLVLLDTVVLPAHNLSVLL